MVAPFEPHTTGHWQLNDGDLIRVDWMRGRWCASHFTAARVLHEEIYGSDEYVHHIAAVWAHKLT
jgi:hypothetical protein